MPKRISNVKFQISNFKLDIDHSKLRIPHSAEAGIAQLLVVMLSIAGIAIGTYLIQQKTNLLPKAASNLTCSDDRKNIIKVDTGQMALGCGVNQCRIDSNGEPLCVQMSGVLGFHNTVFRFACQGTGLVDVKKIDNGCRIKCPEKQVAALDDNTPVCIITKECEGLVSDDCVNQTKSGTKCSGNKVIDASFPNVTYDECNGGKLTCTEKDGQASCRENLNSGENSGGSKSSGENNESKNGACGDNPVKPPDGYRWKADCSKTCKDPDNHSDCPDSSLGGGREKKWCYGFNEGLRCMRLEQTSSSQSKSSKSSNLPAFGGISLGFGSKVDAKDFTGELNHYLSYLKDRQFKNSNAANISKATQALAADYIKRVEACLKEKGLKAPITASTPDAAKTITALAACEKLSAELERKLKEDVRLAKFYEILSNFGKKNDGGCVKADFGLKPHINVEGIYNPPSGTTKEKRRLFFCVGTSGNFKWRVNSNDGTNLERLSIDNQKNYQPIYAGNIPNTEKTNTSGKYIEIKDTSTITDIQKGDLKAIEKLFSATTGMKNVYQKFNTIKDQLVKDTKVKL